MSQKHAVGIVATSFVAGLLATALVFGPQEWSAAYQPYFGLADEWATADPPARHSSQPWWQALVSPATTAPPATTSQRASGWPSWDTVVDSTRQFFRRHFGPRQPAVTGQPARGAMAPPFVVAQTVRQPGTAFQQTVPADASSQRPSLMAATPKPSALPADSPRPESDRRQPRPMTLTHDEMASLERLANRGGPGEVAVTAFSRKPTAVAAVDQRQPSASEATPTLTAIASAGVAAAEAATAANGEGTAEPGAIAPETAPATPRSEPQVTTPATVQADTAAATQGHVARETEIASPESLRALVSRTQSEAAAVAAAAEADSTASVTATAAAVTPAKPATDAPAADAPSAPPPVKPISRAEGTARGLQSAAAALERVEQQAVQSLLTRTLGKTTPPPSPTPPKQPATPQTVRQPSPMKTKVDRPIRRPSRWEDEAEEPLRLEPRHARPQTATAPAPPLRLDSIGKPVQPPATASLPQAGPADGTTAWVDPDGEDWAEAVTNSTSTTRQPASAETPRERILRRLSDNRENVAATPDETSALPPAPEPPVTEALPTTDVNNEPPVKRLLERLRPAERLRDRFGQRDRRNEPPLPQSAAPQTAWPPPTELLRQLDALAAEASPRPAVYQGVRDWVDNTTAAVNGVLVTEGPHAPVASAAVALLADCVPSGMAVADQLDDADADTASELRRVAFAVKRRAVAWQAAAMLAAQWRAGVAGEAGLAETEQATVDLVHLLAAVERFEADPRSTQAAEVQQAIQGVTAVNPAESGAIARAISNHYAAANLRVSLQEKFLTLLMPETTSRAEAVRETVLGRLVRGRRVVEQTTSIRLTPDPDEICFDLVVAGDVSTYAITDTGPISMASRGTGQFTVQKPVKICQQGLVVGPATASASNRARLMNVSTSFDSVPLMGSLLRTLARNQHAENLPAANREVAQKIIWQSCRQTDEESERKFAELAGMVEEKFWNPLVQLGLNPSPFMETTEDRAILRLRLHADAQLAAHTPRPREPENSLLGVQIHQSTLNNAFDRLNIGGHRLSLEDLFVRVQERLGLEPAVPEDIPEGVSVTFEAVDPLRVEFADGLVEVRVAIDALESGRRDWYDVIGRVSYKPVLVGNQVLLERDGPIRIGGPGHRGRIEFALRTIFGKIFPKERPLPVLPKKITEHPRLQELVAAQAVSWDGWFALALADPFPQQLETAAAAGQEPAARR